LFGLFGFFISWSWPHNAYGNWLWQRGKTLGMVTRQPRAPCSVKTVSRQLQKSPESKLCLRPLSSYHFS